MMSSRCAVLGAPCFYSVDAVLRTGVTDQAIVPCRDEPMTLHPPFVGGDLVEELRRRRIMRQEPVAPPASSLRDTR